MKAPEQYFAVVLVIMLYRSLSLFSLWAKSLSMTNQMKASEQYFAVVMFIMLYKGGPNMWMKS